MAAESKLEAARRKGDLTGAISALRDEARTETANARTPVRGEVDLFDAAVHVAAGMAGKPEAERFQALRNVQVGKTLTGAAHGRVTGKESVTARRATRQEKIDRVKAWATTLTEEQRTEYMIGEKYGALSENAQDVIAEAFSQIEDNELVLEDTVGEPFDPATYNFEAELVDPDQLADEDDGETDEPYVDPVDAAYLNEGETHYYTGEENQ
jgi:hypothetical protein